MTALGFAPDWPAPEGVRAWVTERAGGISTGHYESLNLAAHVGDDDGRVAENRARLSAGLDLPSEPAWLEQVHGNTVVDLDEAGGSRTADAAVTRAPGTVCVALTADCLPILLTDLSGSAIAVAHAGWRGLAAGVVENAVAAMGCEPVDLIAWLGPAISAAAYEVGDEVREAFTGPGVAGAFTRNDRGRWQADLYELARVSLAGSGVRRVSGGGFCTRFEADRFFSHRRQSPCGRMATLIWRT